MHVLNPTAEAPIEANILRADNEDSIKKIDPEIPDIDGSNTGATKICGDIDAAETLAS